MSCGPAPSASYTTDVFTPTLTYEVPRRGWFKYEDTPGTFLLVPPGNDLAVVNSGTCDFIGMYTAVVPATLADPDGCVFEAVPGIWSPTKMAAYHSKRPNLTTGRAVPVAIGGLNRVMIDMRTKAGSKLDECTAGAKDSSPPGEFTGVEPSSPEHAVIPGMIMLSSTGKVLLIEVDDIHSAPVGLPALTTVARQLRFTT